MFRVGQKVVCIRVSSAAPPHCNGGILGETYTVRGVMFDTVLQRPGIYLEEIVNPIHPIWDEEWAHDAERFRPLTDISFAHEILRRVSHKQGERV